MKLAQEMQPFLGISLSPSYPFSAFSPFFLQCQSQRGGETLPRGAGGGV